jgi:hypothetical protein
MNRTIIIACALCYGFSANASDMSLSLTYEEALDNFGTQFTVAGDYIGNFKPEAKFQFVNDEYERLYLGGNFQLGCYNNISFNAHTYLVGQFAEGTGLETGLSMDVPITGATYFTTGVNYFASFSDNVDKYEGANVNFGLKAVF